MRIVILLVTVARSLWVRRGCCLRVRLPDWKERASREKPWIHHHADANERLAARLVVPALVLLAHSGGEMTRQRVLLGCLVLWLAACSGGNARRRVAPESTVDGAAEA